MSLRLVPVTELVPLPDAERLDVPYATLSSVVPLPENAKLHDISSLIESFQTYGFVDPIGVNPETGLDWDGNGRREALQFLFDSGEEPPRFILAVELYGNAEWLVPVNPVAFDEVTQRHLAMRLNRENEKGGYDEQVLIKLLQGSQAMGRLEETGYDESALLALLAKDAAAERELAKGEKRSGGGGDFTQINPEAIQTDYQCPSCMYSWSGKPKPGLVVVGGQDAE